MAHICEDLNQRLDALKKQLAELDSLVQAVSDAKSKQELEELQSKSLPEVLKSMEEKKKELERLELNFREELAEYLGVDLEKLNPENTKSNRDGYLFSLKFHDSLTRTELDFEYMRGLEELDLSRTNVQSLTAVPTVKKLDLCMCKSLDEHADFSAWPQLEELNLSYANVQSLTVVPTVKVLYLSGCKLDEHADFSAWPQLETLLLSDTNVQSLTVVPTVKRLDLSGCKSLDKHADFSAWPQLETLNLSYANVQQIWLTAMQKQKYDQGMLMIDGVAANNIIVKPT